MFWSRGLHFAYCSEVGFGGDDILLFHARSDLEELCIAGEKPRQLEEPYAKNAACEKIWNFELVARTTICSNEQDSQN